MQPREWPFLSIEVLLSTEKEFRMNVKVILGTGLVATALAVGSIGVSTAQSTPIQGNYQQRQLRGERRSAGNLIVERRHLENVIDQLQRDRHDYGGHRVEAIATLVQARSQLDAAIEYDRAHPYQ
jgi:hypothetical protein